MWKKSIIYNYLPLNPGDTKYFSRIKADVHRRTYSAHSGRRGLLGGTEEGRVLVVIYEIKEDRRIRVCTARNASNLEKKSYNRKRKGY